LKIKVDVYKEPDVHIAVQIALRFAREFPDSQGHADGVAYTVGNLRLFAYRTSGSMITVREIG
jgi:hypothetical protein